MSPESHPFREPSARVIHRGNVEPTKETITPGEQNAYNAFLTFERAEFVKRSAASAESTSPDPYLPELAYDFVSRVVEQTNTRNAKAGQVVNLTIEAKKIRSQ